ncbi:MAG TPA: DUF937 domain-containing protein [Actinomycetales bacterium]|nr:DUF937 domain-containing protein [Actinomycetales bacterium]
MSAYDDILGSLDLDQLAARVGARPEEVRSAAQSVLPALLGGMRANAQDPAGEESLGRALSSHRDDILDGGVDVARVDTTDGAAIASHIFGAEQDRVVQRLGSQTGAGQDLVRKLIPILAPIVMSYVANRYLGGAGRPDAGGAQQAQAPGGRLGDLLGQVLGGAGGPGGAGSILTEVLGGLLGGGRR